jgi:hypothetical protein
MIYVCLYSFGKDRFLNACIESIYNSELSTEVFVDLYVFTKDKVELMKLKNKNNLHIIFLNGPETYSSVTNTSLCKALENKAEYFLLLNTDTILHPLCISYLIEGIKGKNVGLVGGYPLLFEFLCVKEKSG